MIPGVQPPAYSPVSVRTLWRAGLGALTPGASAARAVAEHLQQHCGCGFPTLTDSGTSALAIAMRAAFLARDRRPVALPAFGCYDLATAATTAGVPVALYDLEPHTLAPDFDAVQRLLAEGISALIAVHPYGVPVPMAALTAATHAAGALIIEDAAQAFGALSDVAPAGAGGDFGIFSFGRGKGITGGSGGALLACTPDAARALAAVDFQLAGKPASAVRDFSVLMALWLLGRPALYALPASIPFLRLGDTILQPSRPPAGPSAVALSAVAASWTDAAAEVEVRRRNADQLMPLLQETPLSACEPAGGTPSWLRLPVLASPSIHNRARERAAWRLGLQFGYPKLLDQLPVVRPVKRQADDAFPGARQLRDHLITLPTHGRLRPQDISALQKWLMDAVRAERGVAAR